MRGDLGGSEVVIGNIPSGGHSARSLAVDPSSGDLFVVVGRYLVMCEIISQWWECGCRCK